MSKKKIGIVRGGNDKHYAKSLKKGGDLIEYIFENIYPKWAPVDILLDKEGVWYMGGVPILPTILSTKVNVIWNTAPSASSLLTTLSIPKIETEIFHHMLEEDRDKLGEHMKTLNINMPRSVILSSYISDSDGKIEEYAAKKAKEVFGKFSPPWIVRSVSGDISMGVHVTKTFPELINSIIEGVEHKGSIVVEELIPGKPLSLHTLSNFRGQDVYHLPLPRSFTEEEKKIITSFGENLFNSLGARHYLKSDLVLSPTRGISLLGVSFVPDFREGSHFSHSLSEVGAKSRHIFESFLNHVL